MGVNVNQIAHHCNRFQVPPPAELAPLLAEIRSLLSTAWSRPRE
ncbi:MAG: plasmid mobilization relaxosome protein MobC [Hyphomicrobiaceae bacterium]